tara:strand:- start:1880 stop:3214 length:1335 start_codon:yes stop_codon:yes gene_type:complete
MIPEQAKSEIRKKKAAGQSWTGIAKWLGDEYGIDIHRTTVQRWHDKEVYSDLDDYDIEEEEEYRDLERIKLDKKVATYKAEASFFKKLYETSIKDDAKKEIIIEAIKNNAPSFPVQIIPKQPTKNLNSDLRKGSTPQVVVAPLTDLHIGDNVNLEQMAGLNSYNIDIFNRRLYGWATQLLNLVELRRNVAPVDELIIPMLGDMVSGDIHEELARTNIDNCMQQMIRGANLIAQAIMFLAPHFSKITIPCVVGNHGRMTRKPPMKDKYMDWDYMLYQWVATYLHKQTHITFSVPKAFINSFEIGNSSILIMHGDSISGAGSNQAISKGVTGLRAFLQFRNTLEDAIVTSQDDVITQFDSVMMGHFHRIEEIDIGTGTIHICGTMKGGDEFAAQRLHAINKPRQLVTYWHPKYGNVGKEVIYLNRYDKSSESFIDSIPELWINGVV